MFYDIRQMVELLSQPAHRSIPLNTKAGLTKSQSVIMVMCSRESDWAAS